MAARQTADELIPNLARYRRRLLLAGGSGGLVSVAGWITNPTQFFQSYLMAYLFVLAISLGCLALGMVHELTGGNWGTIARRPLAAASRVLPALTLLFLPIVFGMPHLYVWTHAEVVAGDEILRHKQLYLNVPFFLVRAALYFVVWNGLAYFLSAWALQLEETGDPRVARKMQALSAGGLLAYGLTITFASFDWLMSLEPHWFSTIYGILMLGGQGLSALAFVIIALAWLSRQRPLAGVVTPADFHDLGNLTLAFVMLWAYFSFSQYLIIWSGNLPEEITWYTHRLQTGWRVVGLALVAFHFAVPFLLLLSRAVKREPAMLAKVAAGILVARLIDLFWLVAPEFHGEGLSVSWLDLLLPLSMVSLWLGCFAWQLGRGALLPFANARFAQGVGLSHD